MNEINKTEVFLDKYRHLENVIKTEFHLGKNESAMNYLIRQKPFREYENELDLCRETRNLLSHNPKLNGEYALTPSDELIAFMDKIIDKIENPLRAKDVMVPKNALCYRHMNASVREAMIALRENSYKYIPILEEGVLAGVFGAKTMLDILINEESGGIEKDATFADVKDYVALENADKGSIRFVPQDMLISDIGSMYRKSSEHKERINLIFVTANGKVTERVLGIITAWEIAAELDR